MGKTEGLLITVAPIYTVIAQECDLLDSEKFEKLLVASRSGRFASAHAGSSCGSWAASRYNLKQPGPLPLRSRAVPWGLPRLNGKFLKRTELASQLLLTALQFLMAAAQAGGSLTIEHLEDR